MALRAVLPNLPHWRHIPRCINAQKSRFLIPSPRLRAPFAISWPRPKSQSKNDCSKAVLKNQQLPVKSSQPSQQHAPGWWGAYVTMIACWKDWYAESLIRGKLSRILIVYGVVVLIPGMIYVWFFVFERVPITGRRRFSWSSRSILTRLDEAERQVIEELQKNEEKLFIRNDYPGLRKIEAVFNRVVKASGLDDVAWEVRVIDEPYEDSVCVFRSGLVLITSGSFHHVISNDDELAAALGHAVACVVARHVVETECIRLADKYFTKPFAWLVPMMAIYPQFILFAAPITGSLLISLYLSRVRPREADQIGLLLMTDAGFDPSGAVSLWKKFNKWEEELQSVSKKRIRQNPQFESTHPHSASRITQIEKWIPEIHAIVGGIPSATDPTVSQPRRVVAMQRRWQEFARERDESRRLIGEEGQVNAE